MNRAWILVNTILGKERLALEELRRTPGVTEAHLVMGDYDIMVFIEADSMKKLNDVLSWNIRRNKNICNTITMVVV